MTDSETANNINEDYLWDRRHKILYRVQLSSLYHRKREAFFAFIGRFISGIAVIGGSAAFAAIGGDKVVKWAAAIVAFSSTFSLVFGFDEKSRKHAELARRYKAFEAEIIKSGELTFTEKDIDKWDAEIRLIESDEPPILRNLVQICQNELAIASGQLDKVHELHLYEKFTAHIL